MSTSGTSGCPGGTGGWGYTADPRRSWVHQFGPSIRTAFVLLAGMAVAYAALHLGRASTQTTAPLPCDEWRDGLHNDIAGIKSRLDALERPVIDPMPPDWHIDPMPAPLLPPTVAPATPPDQLDRLDEALSTLERIQQAQTRLEQLVDKRGDPADAKVVAELRESVGDLTVAVAAIDDWAHAVAEALAKQAQWIVHLARKVGYEPTKATGPGVPFDYRSRHGNMLEN